MNWSDRTIPSVFNMEGGTISANITTADEGKGGGVYNYSLTDFTMRGGAITGHITASYGGGIYSSGFGDYSAVVTVEGGTVSGNQALIDGGGIYNTGDAARIDIKGGEFSGNTAVTDGGGVWTDDLKSLTVSAGVVFSSNRASEAYNRDPADDALYAAQILGSQWTEPLPQGYNNYDINYHYGTPVRYTVTYDANGGNGMYQDSDLIFGSEYVVLSQGDTGIDNPEHEFLSWNTAPDGTGTQLLAGSVFVVSGNPVLYAQWNAIVGDNVIGGDNTVDNAVENTVEYITRRVPRRPEQDFERVVDIEENEVPLGGPETTEIEENKIPLTGAYPSFSLAGSACLLIISVLICKPGRRD